ncbi:LPS translocon maturation chaperone LptM [Pinirhizobacter sp.]|uniref:LPS translocon maturation chaperone LptM n=1 Tax=Pinirhizobacter sp. TaxID=2950432 RepID=UPI002F42BA59
MNVILAIPDILRIADDMRAYLALATFMVASLLSACGNKTDLVLPPPKPVAPGNATPAPAKDVPAPPSTAGLDHNPAGLGIGNG